MVHVIAVCGPSQSRWPTDVVHLNAWVSTWGASTLPMSRGSRCADTQPLRRRHQPSLVLSISMHLHMCFQQRRGLQPSFVRAIWKILRRSRCWRSSRAKIRHHAAARLGTRPLTLHRNRMNATAQHVLTITFSCYPWILKASGNPPNPVR